MTARLAISGGRGLGEALREKTRHTSLWLPTATLVIAAIFIGNAAYEAGNLSGATLGATLLIGAEFKLWILLLLAGVAFFLLSKGTPQLLERASDYHGGCHGTGICHYRRHNQASAARR